MYFSVMVMLCDMLCDMSIAGIRSTCARKVDYKESDMRLAADAGLCRA